MKPDNTISFTERNYLENEEFNKKNQDEVIIKVSKAVVFKKAHGYSLTFSKLMKKWNCSTPDAWRELRRQHKKENYIGPKREKKAVEAAPVQNNNWNNKNKNGQLSKY
jgi:hypothetical protein